MDKEALQSVGIWEEVDMYLKHIGWDKWATLRYPSYKMLICEFLSMYNYLESEEVIQFRLGNKTFSLSVDELNDALLLPRVENDEGGFNKHEFWSQITSLNERYNARNAKDKKIVSHALRYLHRLFAHTIYGRKESDSVVNSNELILLYSMVSGHKIDMATTIALKLHDVKHTHGVIKIGGIVTAIAQFVGFNLTTLPYQSVAGDNKIGLTMMWNMGLIQYEGQKPVLHPHDSGVQPPAPPAPATGPSSSVPTSAPPPSIDDVVSWMQNFDTRMSGVENMMGRMSHVMTAYFAHQGFVPSPYPAVSSPSESFRDAPDENPDQD